jgi:hypothetical protein
VSSSARFVIVGLLAALPIFLTAGYLAAQDAARAQVERVAQTEAEADAEFLRLYNERKQPRAAVPRDSGGAAGGTAKVEQGHRDSSEMTPLRRARGAMLRAMTKYSSVSVNIAPKVIPLAFGSGYGIWAALVVGVLLGWRGGYLRPPRAGASRPQRSTRRLWRFAFGHALGFTLGVLGLVAAALICADLNAYWYRLGALPPAGEFDGVVPVGLAIKTGLPAALATMSLVLGLVLILRGGRAQPFLRLSRARALPLVVAACGAAWIVFSFASLAMYDARWRNQTIIRGVDPYRPGYFEIQIGNAGLTRLGLPLGVGLVMLGVTASFVAPALLRRRAGFLSGATECVDCAQPLLAGQTTCPECGCGHAPRSTGAAAR